MKYLLLFCVCVLYVTLNITAQQTIATAEPVLLNLPKVTVPKGGFIWGGTVQMRVNVNEKGEVTAAAFVSGPGPVCQSVTRADVVITRQAAVDLARKAKFTPATKAGKAVASTTLISIEFPVQKPNSKEPQSDIIYGVNGDNSAPSDISKTGPPLSDQLTVVPDPVTGVWSPPDDKIALRSSFNLMVLSLPKPVYPPAARAVRASGAVQIQVLIEKDGNVFGAQAAGGHPLLRHAAVVAACNARFTPMLIGGERVRVSGIITYNFVP
jgi:TonB family protein